MIRYIDDMRFSAVCDDIDNLLASLRGAEAALGERNKGLLSRRISFITEALIHFRRSLGEHDIVDD